jgi:hypothetical protein
VATSRFTRPHKTLTKAAAGYPTTPAMAARVADPVWSLADIAGLLGWAEGSLDAPLDR